MKTGDIVYARRNPKNENVDLDYNEQQVKDRAACGGCLGQIRAAHNSHGLCFEVQFINTIAVYNPDELTVVTEPEWVDQVRRQHPQPFEALDSYQIPGRGDVLIVDTTGRRCPKPGDYVLIDGTYYRVRGVERMGSHPKVGLLVTEDK